MTHQWSPTITIDAELAKELIQEQFNLIVDTIATYGEGWDNIAFLVNNSLVFRFPRRDMAITCMENEIMFLPCLAQHVSFRFSYPKYIGQPSQRYKYAFAGYSLIEGNMLVNFEPEAVNTIETAHTLATWLHELHHVDIQESHVTLFQGNQDWRLDIPSRITQCTDSLCQYASYFEAAGFSQKELQQQINHFNRFHFQHLTLKTYLHGDLYFKHIIADNSLLLKGLIDWGDTHIGSPGIDLAAAIMLFDGMPLQHFWQIYDIEDDILPIIAAFRAFCHQMAFLPYAYEQQDEDSVKWAKIALRRALMAMA